MTAKLDIALIKVRVIRLLEEIVTIDQTRTTEGKVENGKVTTVPKTGARGITLLNIQMIQISPRKSMIRRVRAL